MRLYIDTNVFIDYITKRLPCTIFYRLFGTENIIVISSITKDEIQRYGCLQYTIRLLKLFHCEFIAVRPEDFILAKTYKTHLQDALHIVIAERMNCDFIITRNKRDFTEAKIPVRGPNEKL